MIGGLGSWWPSRDHPNDRNIENGKNTEKSPGDLRRLAITLLNEIPSADADVKKFSNE